MSQDKREHPRINLKQSVSIKATDNSTLCVAITSNISQDGLGATSDEELESGECCTLVFQLPHGQEKALVTLAATVVYCQYFDYLDGFKIGFQFAESQADLDKVRDWIAHNSPQ